jgi:hypothetical protein
VKWNGGIEYLSRIIALRCGYKWGRALEGITAGFGLRFSKIQLDYAYAPVENLESGHRVSLLMRFAQF